MADDGVNMKDLLIKGINPPEPDVSEIELVQEAVISELSLLIPTVLGLLASILVPMVTCVYFCCYCCGKCGGHLTVRDVRRHTSCCRLVNGIVVLAMAAILLGMSSCVPISGERLGESPRLILNSIIYSVEDLTRFITDFVQDGADIIFNQVNSTIDGIKMELTDLPIILTDALNESASIYFTDIDAKTSLLSQGIENLENVEVQTNASVDSVNSYVSMLESGINHLHGNLSLLKNQCVTNLETFCDLLLDGNSDPVSFNISQLTDVASMVHDLVQTVASLGITEFLTIGNTTFAALPDEIHNASSDALTGVIQLLDEVPAQIKPQIDSLVETANQTSASLNLTSLLDSVTPQVDEFEALRDSYMSTANLVLGGILALISACAILGLCCGCLCTSVTKPGSSALSHNRTASSQCGARCLMLSVVIAFLFILYVLLLGSLLMFVGGNLTVVCQALQDLTAIEKLVDSGVIFGGQSLGELILQDENLTISITHFLQTCRNDGTVYSALNLGQMLNLSALFNASEFVPDLDTSLYTSINTTLQGITLFNQTDLDSLQSELTIPTINGSNYTDQVLDVFNDLDLQGLVTNLTTVSNQLPNQMYKDSYNFLIQQALRLDQYVLFYLKQDINDIGSTVDSINSIGSSLQTASSDLVTVLNDLQSFIANEAYDVFVEALQSFLDKMLEVPTTLINTITDLLQTSVGNCEVIGVIYDTITGSVCIHFLDSFNVFWAALYVGGMTTIVLMIASCKMMKYFRQPDSVQYTRVVQQHNNSGQAATTNRARPVVIQMSSVRTSITSPRRQAWDPNQNNNNNSRAWSILRWPISYYQVMKEKVQQRKRPRFTTGSGSPELLRLRRLSESFRASRQQSLLQSAAEPWLVKCRELEGNDNPGRESRQAEIPCVPDLGSVELGAGWARYVPKAGAKFAQEVTKIDETHARLASCEVEVLASYVDTTEFGSDKTPLLPNEADNIHSFHDGLQAAAAIPGQQIDQDNMHEDIENNYAGVADIDARPEERERQVDDIDEFPQVPDDMRRNVAPLQLFPPDFVIRQNTRGRGDDISPLLVNIEQTGAREVTFHHCFPFTSNEDNTRVGRKRKARWTKRTNKGISSINWQKRNDKIMGMEDDEFPQCVVEGVASGNRSIDISMPDNKDDSDINSRSLNINRVPVEENTLTDNVLSTNFEHTTHITCALCKDKSSHSSNTAPDFHAMELEEANIPNLSQKKANTSTNDMSVEADHAWIISKTDSKTIQGSQTSLKEVYSSFDKELAACEAMFDSFNSNDKPHKQTDIEGITGIADVTTELAATVESTRKFIQDNPNVTKSAQKKANNSHIFLNIQVRPCTQMEHEQSDIQQHNNVDVKWSTEQPCPSSIIEPGRYIPFKKASCKEDLLYIACQAGSSLASPSSLEDLALREYTKMFGADHKCKKLQDRSQSVFDDGASVKQPMCLSVLSSRALLEDNLRLDPASSSRFRYGSASTEIGTTKLTYL